MRIKLYNKSDIEQQTADLTHLSTAGTPLDNACTESIYNII